MTNSSQNNQVFHFAFLHSVSFIVFIVCAIAHGQRQMEVFVAQGDRWAPAMSNMWKYYQDQEIMDTIKASISKADHLLTSSGVRLDPQHKAETLVLGDIAFGYYDQQKKTIMLDAHQILALRNAIATKGQVPQIPDFPSLTSTHLNVKEMLLNKEPLLLVTYRGSYRIQDFFIPGTLVDLPYALPDKPIFYQSVLIDKPSKLTIGPDGSVVLTEGAARCYIWDFMFGAFAKLSSSGEFTVLGGANILDGISFELLDEFPDPIIVGVQVRDGVLSPYGVSGLAEERLDEILKLLNTHKPELDDDNLKRVVGATKSTKGVGDPQSSQAILTTEMTPEQGKKLLGFCDLLDVKMPLPMWIKDVKYEDSRVKYSILYQFYGEQNALSRIMVSVESK